MERGTSQPGNPKLDDLPKITEALETMKGCSCSLLGYQVQPSNRNTSFRAFLDILDV